MSKYTFLFSTWIFLLFVTTGTSVDFNLACPTGWTKIYERCYIAVPTLRSWLEADNYCQKYGGRLSKSTGYLINDLVSNLFSSSSTDYWIGYNVRGLSPTDRAQGRWSDGTSTTVEVGVWGNFEPNTPIGSCTRVSKSTNNKWFMESCDRLLPSVCELLPCPDNTFRCTTTGLCIGSKNLCNGHNDCGDNSDERNCLELPWTRINNVTDCKFYISGTEGEVTMPTTGSQYPASSTCLWTIEAPVGKRIQIQFTQFNTEKGLDVVEFFDGSPALKDGRCLTRLSGSLPESYQVFLSSNNFMNVRFTSDSSRQQSGFRFTWRTNFQCQITKIANRRYKSGQLGDWFTLGSNDGYTRCQSECAEGSNALTCMGFSYNKVNNSCYLLKEVAQPVEDNCCDLYVKTCPESHQTGYPVLDDIPSLGGTRVGTSFNQYIYTPLYPVYYPGDLETSWIIQSSGTNVVTVEVKDIELCGSDTVTFKDGDNPITPTLKTLTSSSKVGEVILSTGNRMYVYMNLKEHMKCRGVLLAYRAGCNFELRANSGTLFSPGYGVVNYPGVLQCFWSITSLNGRTVRLMFDQFNLQNNDYVQVWYGDDDQGTPVHSGNGYFTKPPLITSDSGQLAIKFTTSAIEHRSGFNASFITTCLILSDVSYIVDPVRNSVFSGDTVKVSCKAGYTFQAPYAGEANVVLTCQPDGEYDKTIPVCSQAFCGLVPSITNGYVLSSTGLYGGDQVVYACSDGYSVSGTDLTISCQSNSLWETPPSCTAIPCNALTLAVSNGRWQIVRGNGTSHGSIAEYTCDQNYELIGQSRIECKNGAWSTTAPYCQKIRCPPQYITNGTAVRSGVLYIGDNVTVNCNTGFQINGINPYKCGIDIAPTCQNVNECTAGTATCNQNCVDTIGGYYCTCFPGYKISSNNPSICEDIDECAYNNGQCDHSCVDTNGSYNCTCNFGYSLYEFNGFQGLNLQTGEDGSKPWHSYHIGHSCVLKQCPQPAQVIANGRSLTLQLTFVQGDSVQYLCEVGYVIQGSNSATTTISCQGDGTWSPAVPTCVAATCFLDVTADSKTRPTSSISFGNAYTLVCDSTNSTGITLTRYCSYLPSTKRYGTVGDNLQCPLINCGIPAPVSGSNTFSYSCTTIGCSFFFSCQGSYQLAGTSSAGDSVVRCGVDGRWNIHDLRCISPLCTDPGTPPDALQLSTTYEIGAEVTYQCTRAGFAPSPSTPLRCIPFGSTAVWSPSTIPNCVDVSAPTFTNCFTQNFTVELYKAPNHGIPTVTDQSGYVASVTTSPSNYRPTHVVPNSLVVTYTARDLNNNIGTCSFRVNVKDQVPPTITCSTPQAYVITSESSTITVDPLNLVLSVEGGARLTANSGTFTLTNADVGKVKMITLTAVDDSQNTQSCTVQVYTRVQDKCQPWVLSSANSVRSCTAKTGGNGYDCTFTCQAGYYFSNAVNSQTVSTSCFTNGDWTTYPSDCVARNPAYYRQAFVMRYGTGTLTDTVTCTTAYQSQLQNQWNSMASNLAAMCRNSQPAYSITVSPPSDSSVSRLGVEYSNGIIYATFTFDMTPADYVDTAYQSCANLILNAFVNKQTQINPILSLSSSGSCPSVPSSSVAYDRTLRNYFVCSTNAGVQYINGESKSACFDCPLGYYSNEKRQCLACGQGFYSATMNRDSCDACPTGTNSKKTGLTREIDCYLSCPNGFISTTGEAPCYQCAADSYSSNGQSCTSCTNGRKTIGVGKSTASDCKRPCSPGYYSYNGLEVCTACPRNFYQALSGQTQCLECGGNMITLAEGKTSPVDCMDGFASVCTNRCLNGGTCQVINHDYSCTCPPGYTGNTCANTINPCTSQPCFNGGQCTQTGLQTYTCTCTSNRFTGDRCEHDINDCDFASNYNPCNNGSCHDLVGGYTCLCPTFSGFSGSTCATPRNPCVDSPCTNGQCQAANTIRRKCVCPPGYTGDACETNIDECVSSPCVNGGTCIDGVNSFVCSCPSGYSGTFCHIRGASNVCAGKCSAGQTCVDYYPESKPFCMCPNGYNDNGGSCQLVNFCDSTSCLHGGTCISSYGGYICRCAPGYSGPSCQFIVNNCANDPCLNQGVCINDVNTYQCSCPLTGTGGSICIDNKNNCDPYPCVIDNTIQCHDRINDYYCQCKPGFRGKNCSGKELLCKYHYNTPPSLIDNTIQCHDRINDYYCQCKPGFRGKNCTLGATDCQSFPCLHGSTCVTTATGYQCNCATGWYGNNCENKVDNCDPVSPCRNGAQCYNTVLGYQCACPPGYRGDTCQIDYNLCNITRPCVGPNSTCSLNNGQPACSCTAGYQGDTCNQKTVTCTLSTCKNGGTCRESTGAVTCACVPGFTGTDCGTNIDECASNPCPPAGRCIDGVNSYTCQCNDGKIGPNCDKDLSYNFDIMVEPGLMCGDTEGISEVSVFNLASTKLSVALWVRLTTSLPKVIMSLYATGSITATPEKILEVRGDRVLGSINTNTFTLPFGSGNSPKNILDGLWHHIVVTWNALNADNQPNNISRVFLYVDNTLIQQQDNVATSYTLPAFGYLVIGGTYDTITKSVSTANGITGKLSRLIIAKEEFSYTNVINSLYNNVNFLPTNNIINTPITYLIERGPMLIDYQSELSSGICRTTATCNLATSFPVTTCPIDQFEISTNRASNPNFTEASFSGASSVHYNIRSGDTMTWNTYGVSSVAYNTDTNAAVCVFRFYNKRESCARVSPATPTNGAETCSNPSPNTERCTIQCDQVDNKISQAGPYYYTCSKYGMFDQAERLEPFSYPACASAITRTLNIMLKLNFKLTTSCSTSITSLQAGIRSKFSIINDLWQRKLCNAVNCQSVPVAVTCNSNTDAGVEVLFNTVTDPIINTQSVSRAPQDVIAISVADNDELQVNNASPDKTSMEILLVPHCVEGQQIIGNYCVSCAPGSYYDSNTAKCVLCPKGQYQTSAGQSSCVSCPSGQTTYNPGAQSQGLCFDSCSAGMYFSLTPGGTGKCEFCPVGFYQPSQGSFHCLPCAITMTTPNLGATQQTSCVDPSTITVAPTGGAPVGESIAGGGLSDGEIAAIVLAILLLLLLLILLILCCCRDRLPCFGKGIVEPEDKTPFKYVNRYGEPELNFTSYRLHDIREKRGKLPPITKREREPVYLHTSGADDTRSVHTDISIQVPVFLEKLDGSLRTGRSRTTDVSGKRTFMNDTARSLISDQGIDEVVVAKKKRRTKKKKRRVPQTLDYDENIYDEVAANTSTPRNLAPVTTTMIKPLRKKKKTPSEASFALSASARSRTDVSTSGVYSNGDVKKSRKEQAIKIDSDNEDWR